MQIRNGTVDVTNGSSTVIGNDTTWLSDVEPGGLFGIVRDQALQEILLYEVVDVVSDTELTLSVPYAGESAESVQYTIDQDFTKDGFVLMQNGDRNTAAIYSRTVKKIQEKFDNIPAMGDLNELIELAEGYIEGAEQAQQASEQARDISVAAKEDSEQARDDALLYRQGAEQAEANAELHAQDANQAKEAAEDSQQAAATHEQGASAARIAAEQAQQASEDARDISITKADESAQSADSAEQSKQSVQAMETNVTNLHGEVETNTLTVSDLAVQVSNDRSQVASDKQEVRDDRDEVRGLKTETQIYRNQSEQFKNDAEAAAASAAGGLLPVGGWDASTGNLPPAPSDNTQPWYRITEGGTLPGIGEVGVGDNIYWSSTFEDWFHIDNTERFTSINGYTGGTVELDTGDIPENGPQFHTPARVRGSTLTGLSEESTSKPSASDTVLSALGKIVSKLWGLAVGDVSGLQSALDTKLNSNHPSVTNSREWSASTVPQSEAEGGEATTRRAWTSQRVRQAIVAWWNSVTSSWGRSFVAATDVQAGRSALGLGSMATRDTGTGASEHRTNVQNEDKFVTVDTGQTITGEKTFTGDNAIRLNDSNNPRGIIFRLDSTIFRIMKTESGEPEGSWDGSRPFELVTETGEVRLNNGTNTKGVRIGSPTGGALGPGSINAEAMYVNGQPVGGGNYVTLDTAQTITQGKAFRRPGGSLSGSTLVSFGAIEGGFQYGLMLTDVAELPSNWPDFTVSGTGGEHIIRLRRGGTPATSNVRGFAIGATDTTPDFSVADGFGVVCGNPTGGFKGNGTLNVGAAYVNGQPVWDGNNLQFHWNSSTRTLNIITS